MNDLNNTIIDMTRSLAPNSNQPTVRDLIQSIDFRHYTSPPDYSSFNFDLKNDLLEAWLRQFEEEASSEMIYKMLHAEAWRDPAMLADVVKSRSNWEIVLTQDPWSKLVASLRCAAEAAATDYINAVLEQEFDREAQRFGQYDPGTGEFLGWRMDED